MGIVRSAALRAKGRLRQVAMRATSREPWSRYLCWRGAAESGQLALTFDDGPHPEYTEPVLEELARRNVRATFFVLGVQVERHPDLFQRVVDSGHDIGIHGYDHTLTDLPGQTLRTRDLIREHGVQSPWFRPPRGKLQARTQMWMIRNGYRTVLWSFDPRDSMRARDVYDGPPIDSRAVSAGDVVLLHDDNEVCMRELDILFDAARDQKLQIAPLSELLG